MRKVFATYAMIVLMLLSVVGTAAAQTGDNPTAVPTSQPAAPTTYVHPIVQILGAYFGRATRPVPVTTLTPVAGATEPPAGSPTETPQTDPEIFAAQIAQLHQDGMGFGVLVKLYAMAEASVKACAGQPAPTGPVADPAQPATTCEAVTVEQLVSEFQGGAGMGQLFKTYGKPALLGVGQVRKAMQSLQTTLTPEPSLDASTQQNQKSNHGNGNGNKAAKTPMPHGPNK
jgi:hypothetical protein